MTTTPEHDKRIADMKFRSVYPHYVNKVIKKGKSEDDLFTVITWLTGFDKAQIENFAQSDATFKDFFEQAEINKNAHLITGVICGYRVENIETPLTKHVRYLDKLIDELARGKKMSSILREPK